MVNPRLTKLRVLGLEELDRNKLLSKRWAYYDQSHDDDKDVDWENYMREKGETFLQSRFRGRGYVQATNSSIPFGGRRPTCHTMIVGDTVDTYTALLLGEGRQPGLRFVGDDLSTAAIEALFRYADFWPVLAEGRKMGGAMGAFAVLPEVRKGKMSLRTIDPRHAYVEWTDEAAWIPEIVIEQKRVTIEQLDKEGKAESVEVWRTRSWDETHSYAYKDIPVDAGSSNVTDPQEGTRPTDIELSEPPLEHFAGRCPVVWIQNTLCSDSPYGYPDCEPIYEQVEQLDRSMSMVMRGSRANNDPTLVIKDTRAALSQWTKLRKGYGQVIEVTDKGAATLLETSGSAVKQSWDSINALELRARSRVGTISPNPDNAGAYQSGIALQILHRTETSRAAERRGPLGVGIMQLAQIVWTQLKKLGIRPVGSADEKGVELPPQEVTRTEDGEVTTDLEPHVLGDGGAVKLTWGSSHEPIAEELRTVGDALAKLNGGQPSLSQETTVAYAVKFAQADTDVATELERIRREREEKVGEFDEAMMPDVEEDADLDENGDPIEMGEDGKPATTDQVQHEAMNGIQIKTMADTVVRANVDLAPAAAEFVVAQGFPATDPADTKAAIDAQIAFSTAKREADAPESREGEDTGEQDEAEQEPGEPES